MNTDARRRAHSAYVERLKAEGVKPVTLRPPADVRAAVEAYAKANKLSVGGAWVALVSAGLAVEARAGSVLAAADRFAETMRKTSGGLHAPLDTTGQPIKRQAKPKIGKKK